MADVRRYTGWDGNIKRPLPSMGSFIDHCVFLTGGGLWNNGSWGTRDQRGKKGVPSVHGTGRAVDLSWRRTAAGSGRRGFGNWAQAAEFAQFLVDHSDLLQIELIIDYHPKPFGRAYRCDRPPEWLNYAKPTVSQAPNGDWLHIEISPTAAADPTFYPRAFKQVFGV